MRRDISPAPVVVITEAKVPPPALSQGSAEPSLSLAFELPRIRSPYVTRPAAATVDPKPATPSAHRGILEEAAEEGSVAGYVNDFVTLSVAGFTFLPTDQTGRPIAAELLPNSLAWVR